MPAQDTASGKIQSDCLGLPPGLPPKIMNRLCKPVPAGAQTPELANKLDKNFDSATGTFITFDAPGAGNIAYSGTYSVSINPAGEILGSTTDSNGAVTGFLRSSQGTFTTFNVSGATEYIYPYWGVGPSGSTLNPSGEATGGYGDANFTIHGFVRDPSGAITTFDAPGADITPGDFAGTLPLSINQAGEVTGYYFDANYLAHGFVRDKKGNVTAFDAPDASTACWFGLTSPASINAGGEITGNYLDSGCNQHGFLREPNGAFTEFDVPGFTGITPLTINDGGQIAGSYWDASYNYNHGFLRDPSGAITTFDLPNLRDFRSMQINPAGVLAGLWFDENLVAHGFRRAADGTITTIDVPGAGTGEFQGTVANSINPAGVITGWYKDANSVAHGFLFLPQ
jgi:hypothetical protein